MKTLCHGFLLILSSKNLVAWLFDSCFSPWKQRKSPYVYLVKLLDADVIFHSGRAPCPSCCYCRLAQPELIDKKWFCHQGHQALKKEQLQCKKKATSSLFWTCLQDADNTSHWLRYWKIYKLFFVWVWNFVNKSCIRQHRLSQEVTLLENNHLH